MIAGVCFAGLSQTRLSADTPEPIGPPPAVPGETTEATPLPEASPLPEATPYPEERSDPFAGRYQLEGIASWYGGKFQGRLTANGEVFDTNQLTAAHRELPFGTIVRVINTTNNRLVVVRINDRGPFVDNRVIDLSRAAADIIGLTSAGVAPVRLEIMHYQPASTKRTVQIASFGDRSNADALITRLSEAGLDPAIETASDTGVHRVVIPDVELDEIEAVQDRLASLGHRNVLVREAP